MLNTRDEDPGESIPTFQEGKSLAVRWARMKVVTEICQMSRFLPLFNIIQTTGNPVLHLIPVLTKTKQTLNDHSNELNKIIQH